MEHMTHLELAFWPVGPAELNCLARCLQNAHQMQDVVVITRKRDARRGWAQALRAMPLRGRYDFQDFGSPVETSQRVEDMIRERGFVGVSCGDSSVSFRSPDARAGPVV